MARGSDEGSGGVLTVLFTDIENSTDMTNRSGDTAAREVIVSELDERRGAAMLDAAIAALPQRLR